MADTRTEAPCPVKPSQRPCLSFDPVSKRISYDGNKPECWKTGNWCSSAWPVAKDGTRPIQRYKDHSHELLPHDINAEEAALGALLHGFCEEEIGPALRMLKPADFYRERHCWVMQAILDQKEGIDLVTVADKLQASDRLNDVGGPAYLSYLVSRVPTPFHAVHYARIVKDMAERRRTIERAGKMAGDAYEGRKHKAAAIYEVYDE